MDEEGRAFEDGREEAADELEIVWCELHEAEAEIARLHDKSKQDMFEIMARGNEILNLRAELAETRENAALVVNALSAALQWGEALFAWVPEGKPLPEGVKTAKGALDQAMNAIRSKQS